MARTAKNQTLIEDHRLDPYFITIDEHNHTVNIRITKNKNHFRSTGKNKTYSKSLTYHPSFAHALKWIIKEKMNDNKDYSSLDSFFQNFKNEVQQINNYIDEKINSNS